jgi:SNF2 family DNA or RNA helicase
MGLRRARGAWGGPRGPRLLSAGAKLRKGRPKAAKPAAAPVERRAPPKPPPPLLPFQREGVDFLRAHGWRVLLADAPGCGKTPQALTAIRENPRALCPALAVVPASVLRNWAAEAEIWLPGATVHTLDKIDTPTRRAHLTLTTWDVVAQRAEELAACGYRLLVADEAHYAKNPDTLRCNAIRVIAETTPHVLLLSGTPMLNDVNELEVLRSLFGDDQPPMLRRLLEDVAPQIPPKTRKHLFVTIPKAIRDEYEEVRESFADWLNEYLPRAVEAGEDPDPGRVDRALEIQHLTKLAYLRRVLGRGKAPAAAALIYDLTRGGEPVVVFGHYSDVLDILGQLLTRLGVPYVRVDGGVSTEARHAAKLAFQRGDVPVFVASSAAREGITLHRAAHLIRLERDYVPAYEEQSEDRIRRLGQTRPTTIWYLHAEDTVDARISEIVDAKRRLVTDVIGAATTATGTEGQTYRRWEQIPELAPGVPPLLLSPRGELELPALPDPARVQAVIFATSLWPSDGLQRALRRHGFRTREIEVGPVKGKITCRVSTAFQANTLRPVTVAPGLICVVGRRVEDAERAANRRASSRA